MIRFFDMFAGIGGFRSGLESVGDFKCIGHCEIDKYADKAYRTMYNTEGEYYCNDARKINPEEMPDFDLVCAGFPCQSFSVAGKRLGFEDTRGTLFFEVARLLAAKRPAFFLLENVPGLLSHDGGRTLETIYAALVEMGYHFEWCVHNSKYFGVPQQRRRLYIVGYLDGRCAGEIFPLAGGNAAALRQLVDGPQGQRVYHSDGVACTQTAGAIKGFPKSCEIFWGEEEQRSEEIFRRKAEMTDAEFVTTRGGKTGLYFIDMNPNPAVTEQARCITARQDSGVSNHKGEHSGVLIEDSQHFIDLNADPKITDEARCLHTRMDLEVAGTHKGERSGVLVDEGPRAILTPDKAKVRQQGRRMKDPDEAMFTITAQDRHGIWHKGRVRRLMPIECWRLQGYTTEQFNKAAALGLPDGQLYKMAGNSVSVPVISAIGQRIRAANEKYEIVKE